MDKIVTQDCYLPVKDYTGYAIRKWDNELVQYANIENVAKHTGMVVLTVEQFEKVVSEAYNAGAKWGVNPYSENTESQYIASILK